MPFNLHEVTDDSEFGPIVLVQKKAYSTPFNAFWEMLEGKSLDDFDARQKLWHHHDPTSHWIYVTDENTGKVAGAMQWNIIERNPYEDGAPTLLADWWTDGMWSMLVRDLEAIADRSIGDMRELSNQVFAQFFGARPSVMNKPHFRK